MGAGNVADPRLDGISAGQTVLHVSRGASDGSICRELTRTDGEPADEIRIAYDREPMIRPLTDEAVNRTRVVVVGDGAGRWPGKRVRTVRSVDDLTGVGIRVGETMDELGTAGRPLVVCFDGAEAVFDAVSFETAFEFFHLLTRQLSAAGAQSHFHLDPTGHDERVASRLSTLFDVVVDEEADGTLAVRSR